MLTAFELYNIISLYPISNYGCKDLIQKIIDTDSNNSNELEAYYDKIVMRVQMKSRIYNSVDSQVYADSFLELVTSLLQLKYDDDDSSDFYAIQSVLLSLRG